MSAMIKLQVSTADVLPVTNSMSSSDQMSTNVSISMNATMPLIDAMTMPPAEIPLVATHVNVTLVSLGMDSNVLISMSAMTTHVMLLQPVPIALVHSAANVNTDGLVMDSLVTDHNEYENDLQRLDQVCVDNAFFTNTDGGFT